MHCTGCGSCKSRLEPQAGESSGAALALRVIIIFLLPLVLAILGAALFRASPHTQALGAVGGLMLGGGLSRLICNLATFREKQ